MRVQCWWVEVYNEAGALGFEKGCISIDGVAVAVLKDWCVGLCFDFRAADYIACRKL